MIFLRDLGSTNGTYHNGQRVSVSRLRNGDTIGVGRSVLKLDIRTDLSWRSSLVTKRRHASRSC